MRRLASIFTSKRSDQSDVSSNADTVSSKSKAHNDKRNAFKRFRAFSVVSPIITPNLSRNPSTPRIVITDAGQSSGDSSSGSASLRTPDDDVVLKRTPSKKFWISWLGAQDPNSVQNPSRQEWDGPSQDWASRRALTSQPAEDTDDETSSESDEESESLHTHTFSSGRPVTIVQSRKNLQILTSNKLISQPSTPPLLHSPDIPLFPRSCNLSRLLPTQGTLQNSMHRRLILRHLKHSLNRNEEMSISPFGSRAQHATKQSLAQLDDIPSPDSKHILPFSRGLKRWTSRACFEERMLVWTPDGDTGEVRSARVKGTAFAVAELEFSEPTEVLAGFLTDIDQLAGPVQEQEPAQSSSSSSSLATVPIDTRKLPYKAVPSPLRMQHQPSSYQKSPSASLDALGPAPDPVTSPTPLVDPPNSSTQQDAQVPPAATSVKRGVRFAEDDKDDQIPLGYVLRMKKRREEKAKSLQEARERRAFEEERLKVQEERRKRDAERKEWERERKAWERERKAMEEERKQKLYAEEVAAARRRRESQRGGATLGTSTSSSSLSGEADFPPIRDNKRYSRPVYDSMATARRQTSEPLVTYTGSEPPSQNMAAGSSQIPPHSEGSRPGSRHNSRPSSLHSNYSSEDVWARDGGGGTGSKRSSLGSTRPRPDRASTWSSGHIPPVPMLPAMPMLPMDTPLLPPAPPFMMQQYPRQRSQNSTSTSPGRIPGQPSNRSSTRVNQQNDRRPVSSTPSSPGLHEFPPALPREYQRRSSGDEPLHQTAAMTASRNRRSASQPSAAHSHVHPPLPSPSLLHPPAPTNSKPSAHKVFGRPTPRPQTAIS